MIKSKEQVLYSSKQIKLQGPGDIIAKTTSAIGIKPCDGCKRRQQRINKWWFDLTDKLANAMK